MPIKIIKTSIMILSVLAVMIALSLLIERSSQDDEVDEIVINSLYKDEPDIPQAENVAYAIIGFTAPEDVEDIHEYGVSLVDEALKASAKLQTNSTPKFKPAENELKIINETEKNVCWWKTKYYEATHEENCMSSEELIIVIGKNITLLSRYMTWHKYSQIKRKVSESRNDGLISPSHRIFLAYLRELIQQNKINLALKLLSDDIKLWKNLAREHGTWLQKMRILLALNDDLRMIKTLTELGHYNFYHQEYMHNLFEPIGIQNWALADTYTVEFRLSELKYCLDEGIAYVEANTCLKKQQGLFYQRNKTLKRISEHIEEMVKTIAPDPENVYLNCLNVQTEENEGIKDWLDKHLYNYKGNKVYEHFTNYSSKKNLCDVLRLIHRTDASLLLIKRYVEILQNGSGDIEKIINKNDEGYYSYPLIWDQDNNTISIDKGNLYQRDFELRLPPLNEPVQEH